MSLRGPALHHHAFRSRLRLLRVARSPRARFSQRTAPHQKQQLPSRPKDASIRHDTSSTTKSAPPPREPPSPLRSRYRLPAFIPFLLALPLGWYLSTPSPSTSSPTPSFFPFSSGSRITYAAPSDFVPYTLVAREPLSSTAAILHLRPTGPVQLDLDGPALASPASLPLTTSLEVKQPQLQIARAYTPLPHVAGQPLDEVRLLVRRVAPRGEVSAFLHRLPVGASVGLRGLRAEYSVPRSNTNEDTRERGPERGVGESVGAVAFLAGGTGIAPALQVADALEGRADVRILWANRRREDCLGGVSDAVARTRLGWTWWRFWETRATGHADPEGASSGQQGELVRRLEGLKAEAKATHGGRVQVDYFVDDEGSFIRPADVQKTIAAFAPSPDESPRAKRRLLFVSGPEPFVDFWAGPKRWINGREEQGPLGGVLAKLDLTDWEVVKL